MISWRIRAIHTRRKISSLFYVHLKAFSECDLLPDALRRYPVCNKLYFHFSLLIFILCLGHSSPILCASFSPTGEYLATGSGDCTARLWDLNTELPSHTLVGHKGWVLCVEWEAMGRKVATGGHDGQVRLWDPKAGKALGDAMKGHTKWITSLSWEPIHL